MTVRINKPALNLREEISKAQGVVRYEQRQFWAGNLVNNGTFDNDTSGWTGTYSTLSVTSGVLRVTNTANNGWAIQKISTKVGKRYKVTFDIPAEGASNCWFTISRDTNPDTTKAVYEVIPTTGSFTYYWDSLETDYYVFLRVNGGASAWVEFDNVAVFEVDENDNVIHSVPLGFKPVHVYEDGLLQREGENHDYTVVDTGFEYQIKPTVAPTGATETCVIAEREL